MWFEPSTMFHKQSMQLNTHHSKRDGKDELDYFPIRLTFAMAVTLEVNVCQPFLVSVCRVQRLVRRADLN